MKRFTLSFIVALAFVFGPIVAWSLYTDPASTSSNCDAASKYICYHSFANTDDTTTADSDPYDVSKCRTMDYRFDGDGTASLFVKECSTLTSGACTTADTSVFTCDMNGDGQVNATDEAIAWDGTAGKRGCRGIRPTAAYHYVDVQAVPGSGTVHLSIKCSTK